MIKMLLFDINGTIIDILTDESRDDIYRTMSNLMDYQGIKLSPETFREEFWDLNKKQRSDSEEKYPEFDVIAIFKDIIDKYSTSYTHSLPAATREALPGFLAQAFRAGSLYKLSLYPGVASTLKNLAKKYRMAAISDGQSIWALPELNSVGITSYFERIVISSDFGFRKPDPRMYEMVLKESNVNIDEVIFIGNDMYRDIVGPGRLGMKTVFFRSNQGDQRSKDVEPDYIAYSFSQIQEAIDFIKNSLDPSLEN